MQKKVLAVNDISTFGKCSLTAAIPIISALDVQCCPLVTSVLSNQTEYREFAAIDISDKIGNFYKVWKNLGFSFDLIYTGFMENAKQIESILEIIDGFPEAILLVDPIMAGENGLYPCFDQSIIAEYKKLISKAKIIVPNWQESLLLVGENINLEVNDENLNTIVNKLHKLGPKKIIITGIVKDNKISNYISDLDQKYKEIITSDFINKSYSGTGDIFASIISALLVKDKNLIDATKIATDFIKEVVEYSSMFDQDRNHGVFFEPFLSKLSEKTSIDIIKK